MSTKSFRCIMQAGKSRLYNQNPVGYKQFLSLLEEGEELIVEFKRKKFVKSNPQLAYAYTLLEIIKQETGNTIQGLDLWVKRKMGKCYEEVVEGQRELNCASKADFTKEEMSEYITHLLELAQKYQILVPELL